MEPTIAVGDRLIVQEFSTNARPSYGQVVALRSPDDNGPDLVKRVIGVPGDLIEVRRGVLYRNGTEEPPPNGRDNYHPGVRNVSIRLGPDQFYVLGDNRPHSHDSTEFGAVDAKLIYGYVAYRYSPWSNRGKIK
jgi:signal peptidase I